MVPITRKGPPFPSSLARLATHHSLLTTHHKPRSDAYAYARRRAGAGHHSRGDPFVPIDALQATALALLRQVRVPPAHAEQIVEVLIDTELRGYSDHGILSLGRLIDRCRTGAVNPTPRPRIVREAPAAMLLDADQGCGIIASRQAMDWCIAAARTQGLASAGVTNSSHFIGCAFYVEMAAARA